MSHTETSAKCYARGSEPNSSINELVGYSNHISSATKNLQVTLYNQECVENVNIFEFRDFHSDLYPDTPGCKTELTADQWFQGKNVPVPKINLDPAKRDNNEEPIIVSK